MKLLINEKNEIESYSIWGDIEGAVDFTGTVPDDFLIKFVPYLYLLQDDKIVENPDYVEPEPPEIGPSKQDKINAQLMLNQATQKQTQDAFNAQILIQIAKLGGAQ
jgi:hypothetical protein